MVLPIYITQDEYAVCSKHTQLVKEKSPFQNINLVSFKSCSCCILTSDLKLKKLVLSHSIYQKVMSKCIIIVFETLDLIKIK